MENLEELVKKDHLVHEVNPAHKDCLETKVAKVILEELEIQETEVPLGIEDQEARWVK